MKHWNMHKTDSVNVTRGTSFYDVPYVCISVSAGSLQFIHMMSTEQAKALGGYLLELAAQAEEVTAPEKPWYAQGTTV